jgi:hypothetical protein
MYQGCVMTNASGFFEMDSPGLGHTWTKPRKKCSTTRRFCLFLDSLMVFNQGFHVFFFLRLGWMSTDKVILSRLSKQPEIHSYCDFGGWWQQVFFLETAKENITVYSHGNGPMFCDQNGPYVAMWTTARKYFFVMGKSPIDGWLTMLNTRSPCCSYLPFSSFFQI